MLEAQGEGVAYWGSQSKQVPTPGIGSLSLDSKFSALSSIPGCFLRRATFLPWLSGFLSLVYNVIVSVDDRAVLVFLASKIRGVTLSASVQWGKDMWMVLANELEEEMMFCQFWADIITSTRPLTAHLSLWRSDQQLSRRWLLIRLDTQRGMVSRLLANWRWTKNEQDTNLCCSRELKVACYCDVTSFIWMIHLRVLFLLLNSRLSDPNWVCGAVENFFSSASCGQTGTKTHRKLE